jgi:hypothetical protein
LDRYGEFTAPEGAKLLLLHTIKPDGTIVEPESVPGKDGLSLRDLEIGDVLEFEYIIAEDPAPMLPGHVDLGRFRFQSLDVPFHHSELLIVYPPDLEKQLRVERRNDAPETERGSFEGLSTMRFLATQVVDRPREPQARSMLDELPMVRVHTRLELDDYAYALSARVREAQRANPELRRLARKVARKGKTKRAKLRALWAWVVENIEEAGDLSTAATRTLGARQGNRMMLLKAMLEEVGVQSELWLARDAFGPTQVGPDHPLYDFYTEPMLAVDVGEKAPLVVLTASRVLPLGYLTPSFSGTKALRIPLDDGDGPPAIVDVPESPEHLTDRRSYELELRLDKLGDGTLEGTIELQGLEALQWRTALEQIDRDRVEEVFQTAELSSLLPGATLDLESLEIENEKRLQDPLILRFVATVNGAGVDQGGELVLPATVVGMNQGIAFTRLPKRWSGVVIPYAAKRRAKVTLTLEGLRFRALPEPAEVEGRFGSFHRTVEGAAGEGTVVIETRSTLRPGVIAPEKYPELTRFTQQLQGLEQAILRAR